MVAEKESLIDDLLALNRYIADGQFPQQWFRDTVISAERTAIMSAIQQGDHGVYGFTTLLGPLDNTGISSASQRELLDAHLVGEAEELDIVLARAISAVKFKQLGCGGSGISHEAYGVIEASLENLPPITIDFEASYGSGDVVPGAWWANSLFPADYEWQPGDVISLINGNFVSAGYAAVVLRELLRALASLYDFCLPYLDVPVQAQRSHGLESLLAARMRKRGNWDTPPQRSVAVRDGAPLVNLVSKTVRNLAEEVGSALSSYSGNPMFVFEDDRVATRSQSSFLQPTLTTALAQTNFCLAYLSGTVQRVTEIAVEEFDEFMELDEDISRTLISVQPPKVSEAYRQRISRPLGFDLSGSMSGGVEDLWDNSLMIAHRVLENTYLLQKQLRVLETMLRKCAQLSSVGAILSERDISEKRIEHLLTLALS